MTKITPAATVACIACSKQETPVAAGNDDSGAPERRSAAKPPLLDNTLDGWHDPPMVLTLASSVLNVLLIAASWPCGQPFDPRLA